MTQVYRKEQMKGEWTSFIYQVWVKDVMIGCHDVISERTDVIISIAMSKTIGYKMKNAHNKTVCVNKK